MPLIGRGNKRFIFNCVSLYCLLMVVLIPVVKQKELGGWTDLAKIYHIVWEGGVVYKSYSNLNRITHVPGFSRIISLIVLGLLIVPTNFGLCSNKIVQCIPAGLNTIIQGQADSIVLSSIMHLLNQTCFIAPCGILWRCQGPVMLIYT